MDIKLLREVEALCEQYYDETTLQHARRVADYVLESPLYNRLSAVWQDVAYAVALLHDIIEDNPEDMSVRNKSEVLIARIGEQIWNGRASNILQRLTQEVDEDYLDYIVRLRNGGKDQEKYDVIAYIVKLADMKDHLMQKDTLTDKLKEKYWEALPYLL